MEKLTKEQHTFIYGVLEPCHPLIIGIIRVFKAYPASPAWIDASLEGALALVIDENGNYHLKLVDCSKMLVSMQILLPPTFIFQVLSSHFCAFPTKDCVIGFQFIEKDECTNFSSKLSQVIRILPTPPKVSTTVDNDADGIVTKIKKKLFSETTTSKRFQISAPIGEMEHVASVQWDPNGGFSLQGLPPSWQEMFSEAGITSSNLENSDVLSEVLDVVAKYGGEVISEDQIAFHKKKERSDVPKPPLTIPKPKNLPKLPSQNETLQSSTSNIPTDRLMGPSTISQPQVSKLPPAGGLSKPGSLPFPGSLPSPGSLPPPGSLPMPGSLPTPGSIQPKNKERKKKRPIKQAAPKKKKLTMLEELQLRKKEMMERKQKRLEMESGDSPDISEKPLEQEHVKSTSIKLPDLSEIKGNRKELLSALQNVMKKRNKIIGSNDSGDEDEW
eukprot:TRINITY_DN1002_c0_g1_i1.p1 TRINITY_DN1002_c0_g1~~TRINITY_DN1002_c0_g1_i1.p1  ORF type:complete len:443 (-),score=101.92 TRINITY_DN1002_c0_g1_i1:59-1387(-)